MSASHIDCQSDNRRFLTDLPDWDALENGLLSSECDPLLGLTIDGKFRIENVLGTGSWSRVYKARELMTDRLVAVKILHARLVSDTEIVARFERELQSGLLLNHPNICSILGYGCLASGQPYIMMEYVEGQTLSAILRRSGFLPVSEGMPIFVACCSALHHAHAQGVVHRDIKPGNIMVATNGETKLLDFGLARFLYDKRQDLTQSGTALGAVHYMSPEQAFGRCVDARCDVYSLACVIYEVLCGKPVFEGNSAFAVIEKHMRIPVRKFCYADRAQRVNPALEATVLRALEKDPNERFDSAEEFGNELNRAASATGSNLVPKAALIAAAAISSMFLIAYLFLLLTHHI